MNFYGSNFPLVKWVVILLVNFALICGRSSEFQKLDLYAAQTDITGHVYNLLIGGYVTTRDGSRLGKSWCNSPNISIYALANCYQDLPHRSCLLYYAASRTRLPRCLPDSAEDKVNCSSSIGIASGQELATLNASAKCLIEKLTVTAVASSGYASAHLNEFMDWHSVGGMSKEGCRECLDKASRDIGMFPEQRC
ncbi:hypothetical protein HAX54_049642 [Datura stramonium]|uniref:Gnk2-homologous domain-containing protein n=1 Tax=Datura stramonium TaxID=4076 RepID=A0ABS8SVU9_DATST|nr:hypothetical protein [Datura stramonium]